MMKKGIVLLMAMALTAGFTGCQRESVQTSGASSGRSVNTQLVLSVANGTAQTKQTADAVQVTGGFQGLKDAYLLTYTQTAGDGKILAAPATSPNEPIELNYLFSGEATRRVVNVKLAENTNTLVFYGRGVKTAEPDKYGKLGAYSVAQNVGETYFGLGARLTDKDGFDAMKLALANILTDVMGTSLDGTAFDLDEKSVTAEDYASCKSWADYGSITDGKSKVEPDMALYIWEEKLSNLYKQMTSNDSEGKELRSGSGRAILSMVRDMWKEIYPMTITPATTKAEAVAKKLAQAINTKLEGYFSYTTTGEPAQPNWAEPLTFDGENDYAKFPTNFNLMEGAAYLTFDATNKKFVYPEVLNMMGMGSGFKATDFYYPAELLYFGNSPVQTSNVEYSAGDYPSSSTAWSSKDWTTGWPGTHVTATSRSVAMVKNIRYGVAMLETRVEYKGVDGSIKTNNPDLPDQTMAINTVATENNPTTFELTGIIVGGQPKQVGWNFLPKSGQGQGFIYDKFDAVSVPFPADTYNYTVVFDNYNESAATATPNKTKQDKVYVALEFLNNGDDFYGKKNWVRKGEHFYLVGELDPGDPQASTEKLINWPTDGTIIPPYNDDGTSTKQPRIFVQDYKTTVTFKIGPNSLQYAYLTVPDLRSSNMTLGLSVDIQWKQGLIYNEVVVGQ